MLWHCRKAREGAIIKSGAGVTLGKIKGGEELKIIVANTPANECERTEYFNNHLQQDVGPYHNAMSVAELKEKAGGLFDPIVLEKKI